MTLQLGLIGYGYAAQCFHLPLIRHCKAITLAGVSSSKPASQMPQGARHFDSANALIADPAIEAVTITAPNTEHYPLALKALEAGKHVILEKPMVLTSFEAQSLITAAKSAGKILTVFHNRRLDGDYLTLKRLIAENRVGAVHRLVCNWDRFRPEVSGRWREQLGKGAGIWQDLAPHMLDQAVQLFGLPERLTAVIRPLRPNSEAPDYAHVSLHYPDKEVVLSTSPYVSAPTMRFCLEGEAGCYVKYGLDPQENQMKDGVPIDSSAFGTDPENTGMLYDANGTPQRVTQLAGRFAAYYENFALAVNGNAALLADPVEALQIVALTELAEQSAALGRSLPVVPAATL